MASVRLIVFARADGTVPLTEWIAALPPKARAKCYVRLEELGHELRRPEADYLRDGIHELRMTHDGVNYRTLYFFHGRSAVVLSHGLTKQRSTVPPMEVERAIRRKQEFEADPERHTSHWTVG